MSAEKGLTLQRFTMRSGSGLVRSFTGSHLNILQDTLGTNAGLGNFCLTLPLYCVRTGRT